MDNLRDVVETVDKLEAIGRVIGGNTGTANVHINAGGFGIWVCVTASVVCVVLMVVLAMNVSDIRADVRELRQTTQLQQAYIDKLLSLSRKQP